MRLRFIDVFKAQVYWRLSTGLLWGAILVGVPLVLSLVGTILFLIVGVIQVMLRSVS
jgi:hypothetical protein